MRFIAITAILIALTPLAWASESAKPDQEPGVISFILENDAFYGPDRHYTQGLQLNYTYGDNSKNCLLRSVAEKLQLAKEGKAVRCGFGFGQSIFTPGDLSLAGPIPNDRPYAGWLYLNLMYAREANGRLDTAQLNIGVVGPHAFGEFVQNEWHDRILDIERAQGWDNQLRDEPGIALTLERRWRCGRKGEDGCVFPGFNHPGIAQYFAIDPHVGVSLGNVNTHGAAGLTAKLGFNLNDQYGPPRIRPALAGSTYFRPGKPFAELPVLGGVSFYAFAGIEGRAVARNIFLDGNTFRDSLSVDKRHVVGDLQAGGVIQIGRLQIGYTHILRSKEFRGQAENDRFGAVTIQLRAFRF